MKLPIILSAIEVLREQVCFKVARIAPWLPSCCRPANINRYRPVFRWQLRKFNHLGSAVHGEPDRGSLLSIPGFPPSIRLRLAHKSDIIDSAACPQKYCHRRLSLVVIFQDHVSTATLGPAVSVRDHAQGNIETS